MTRRYDRVTAGGSTQILNRPFKVVRECAWIGHDYDDAHRRVAVYGNRKNRVDYAVDNVGNRITENTRDPGGVLKPQLTRSIDALGRMQ